MNRRKFLQTLPPVSVGLMAFPALAQVPFSGGNVEFVLDRAADSIRPVIGVPGSAHVDAPVADIAGFPAAVAGETGIYLDASGLQVLDGYRQMVRTTLPEVPFERLATIKLSKRATAAALLNPVEAKMWRFQKRSSQWSALDVWPLPRELKAQQFVVTDHARVCLINGGALQTSTSTGDWSSVSLDLQATRLSLTGSGQQIVVAGDGGSLVVVDAWQSSPVVRSIAPILEGSVVNLVCSGLNDNWVWAVLREPDRILRISISGSETAQVDLPFSPTAAYHFAGKWILLEPERKQASSPFYAIDSELAAPILFIPAGLVG